MRNLASVFILGTLLCSTASAEELVSAQTIPIWWSIPFVALLAGIALVPLIHKHFWEKYFAHIAVGLGAVVASIYATQLGSYGREALIETALDYFKFIALIGSLFVVSGGILIDVSGSGNPRANTLLLASSLILANLVGTTGASVLLIRPFLRMNRSRLRPFHTVLFIFIVSNCAGALTPIGDPPLFLGYLNGVPFAWTILNCWAPWLVVNALLLAVFGILDSRVPCTDRAPNTITLAGWKNIVCLGIILIGVFIDQLLAPLTSPHLQHVPFGALLMLAAASVAYRQSDPRILQHNHFHFGPIKEVALLFLGIFATMMPALAYLATHAEQLKIQTPGGFYFACGTLSSVLDNAPAYLNFLSAAQGLKSIPLTPAGVHQFAQAHPQYLRAISLGAVFFGACTYIGNGPNFMIKSIAESAQAPTPTFFTYIFRYTVPILIPIYMLIWFIFLR